MQIESHNSASSSKQVLPKRPAAGRSEQVKKTAGNTNRAYGFRNKAMDSVNLSKDVKDFGKVGPSLAQPVYGAPAPSGPGPSVAQPVYGAPMPSSPWDPQGSSPAQPVYGAPMPSNPFEPKGSPAPWEPKGSPAQPVYGAPMPPSNPFDPKGSNPAQPVYGAIHRPNDPIHGAQPVYGAPFNPGPDFQQVFK